MGINKIGGLPIHQNISIKNQIHARVDSGHSGIKSPKAGISALHQPRIYNNTVNETKTNIGGKEGLPTKMPKLNNQSMGLFQSKPFGGGGLSRASGMSLGRNQF